jgi:hypothetical protein
MMQPETGSIAGHLDLEEVALAKVTFTLTGVTTASAGAAI